MTTARPDGPAPSDAYSDPTPAATTATPPIRADGERTRTMSYQTTVGWSLLSSGIVTLLLTWLPYPSFYWGIALLIAGIVVLYVRQT